MVSTRKNPQKRTATCAPCTREAVSCSNGVLLRGRQPDAIGRQALRQHLRGDATSDFETCVDIDAVMDSGVESGYRDLSGKRGIAAALIGEQAIEHASRRGRRARVI